MLIKKRYGKTIRELSLKDIETVESTFVKSNLLTPYKGKRHKAGTLRWWGGLLHDIDILKPLDIEPVTCKEQIDEVRTHQTTQKYIEWAKAGEIPPPITVTEGLSGKFYSMDRRRLYAMHQAGVKKALVWQPIYGIYAILAGKKPKKQQKPKKHLKR